MSFSFDALAASLLEKYESLSSVPRFKAFFRRLWVAHIQIPHYLVTRLDAGQISVFARLHLLDVAGALRTQAEA